MSVPVRAGVVVTGTEMLTGLITDRNGPWIAARLGDLGVEVAAIFCVGDRPEHLHSALRHLGKQGVDLIVTSGGLGPTADDVTAEVVARYAGSELVLDEAMEAVITEIIAGFGAALANFDQESLRLATRKQAMVPAGATTVRPAGTAPGLVVPAPDGPVVVVLPGPPRELQAMFGPAMQTEPVRAVLSRSAPREGMLLRLFFLPESEIAATLRGLESRMDLSALEVTTCLRSGELEVDIRYQPGSEAVRDALIDEIASRHGDRLFSSDGSTVDDQVAGLLAGRKIGLAESCTGGLLAARLTDRPGSSDYVAGGVVSYSNEAKIELLGVPAELIESVGAVSPEVARAMADGARARFNADVGVGITGIAGPGGGTETKPVGTVCLCVTGPDGAEAAQQITLPGDRGDVRTYSVVLAMHLIRQLASGLS